MVLTWYILKQCLHSLVLSSLVLVVLVWLSQTLRLVELLVNNGALVADSLLVTLLLCPFGRSCSCRLPRRLRALAL